ncbi:MAG: M16 family metallopeptidase [Alphaproteobacteria bacterium]
MMTVRLTSLPSGLTVVSHPMGHLESAALGVWVGAGSRSELESEHGLSHLLEHMAFKGTRNRTATQIAEEIEAVGGDVNASTSVETTAYYVRTLKGDVDIGLDILGDILRNSVFDADELEREKHVILQEIGAARDTPDDLVFDLFTEAAYPDQPIGRSILGTTATVSGAERGMLDQYLQRHYRGPSMVVAAAGALDHELLVERVGYWFGDIGADNPPAVKTAHYVGGERFEHRDLMEAQIVLGFQGCSYASDDYYTAQLLAGVLGGGMSSRLFQEVREKRGLCYSIYAFHWSFADTGIFGVHAATSPQDVKTLIPVVLDELAHAAAHIGEADLARAKAQLRAGLLMTLEHPASRAGQLARQMQLYGRPISTEELLERTGAITTDDIQRVARNILTGSLPTVAGVGQVADVPNSAAIGARFDTLRDG